MGSIRVPLREIEFRFTRSSGPGGQNVNKVSSKAVLRWPIGRSGSLPPDVRRRFSERFHGRISRDGVLVIASQRHRDQGRNIADCIERLRRMIAAVARAPARRRPTKPGRAAREKRMRDKRSRSEIKRLRGRVSPSGFGRGSA